MKIGIFAKTFAGSDPATVMAASAKAGFAGVAYNMACSGLAAMPDDIPPEVLAAVAAARVATGQQIMSMSGTYNMIHPDPQVRADGHRRLEVLAGACKALGVRLITLCTGTRDAADQWRHHPDNQTSAAWDDLLASFAVAVQIAERHDVLLGVEPELANVVNSAEAARRLIDDMQSDRIRIVLDPANLFEQAEPAARRHVIEAAVDGLADRIVMAHAKDRAADGSFATTGQGVIDFDHFLGRLRGVGFDGPLVTHGLRADEAAGVADFLQSRLQALGA
jgi:sugar phosphate isomerase/epimerase